MAVEFDDEKRLKALARYRVLDTEEELSFDTVTELTAQIFDVPICLVTFIDRNRQWFKSHYGLTMRETPREYAFCDHAIRGGQPLVIPDATRDPRFADNPLVTSEPNIRFYAGVPLRSSDGQPLGTLCTIDRRERTFSRDEMRILVKLASLVEIDLEIRQRVLDLEDQLTEQTQTQRKKAQLAAMLVHDLRNPLTTISMNIGFAQQSITGESREALDDAMLAMTRLQRHVLDVLDLYLAEASDLEVHLTNTPLEELVNDLRHATNKQVKERQVSLLINGGAGVSWSLDRELILRMLINLVENAAEHSPAGSQIRLNIDTSDRRTLRVTVDDEGPGVADVPDVFAFGPRRSPGGRRRGIGLAFCKLSARAHGGDIWADPAPEGARFRIEIPAPPSS